MLCDVTLPSCFSQCCGLILYITKCELNALPGFILLPMELLERVPDQAQGDLEV